MATPTELLGVGEEECARLDRRDGGWLGARPFAERNEPVEALRRRFGVEDRERDSRLTDGLREGARGAPEAVGFRLAEGRYGERALGLRGALRFGTGDVERESLSRELKSSASLSFALRFAMDWRREGALSDEEAMVLRRAHEGAATMWTIPVSVLKMEV